MMTWKYLKEGMCFVTQVFVLSSAENSNNESPSHGKKLSAFPQKRPFSCVITFRTKCRKAWGVFMFVCSLHLKMEGRA